MPRIIRTSSHGANGAVQEPEDLDLEALSAFDDIEAGDGITHEPPRDAVITAVIDESDPYAQDYLKQRRQDEAAMAALSSTLDKPIEAEFLKKKKGYGTDSAKDLTYIPWYVVVARLNHHFGHNGWETRVLDIKTFGATAEEAPRFVAATVELTVRWPDGRTTTFTNVGSSVTAGKTWSSFEMAYKGAVSDGVTRCAKMLGDAFGLTLYNDETVPTVADDKSASAEKKASPTPIRPRAEYPVASDDEDEEAVFCEEPGCTREIRGYTSKSGYTYTTAQIVAYSKKDTGGIYCGEHKKAHTTR